MPTQSFMMYIDIYAALNFMQLLVLMYVLLCMLRLYYLLCCFDHIISVLFVFLLRF